MVRNTTNRTPPTHSQKQFHIPGFYLYDVQRVEVEGFKLRVRADLGMRAWQDRKESKRHTKFKRALACRILCRDEAKLPLLKGYSTTQRNHPAQSAE